MLAGIIVLEQYVAFLFKEYQLNWLNRVLNVHSLHKLLSRSMKVVVNGYSSEAHEIYTGIP